MAHRTLIDYTVLLNQNQCLSTSISSYETTKPFTLHLATMQRLHLTFPKRVLKPPRPFRISWNRGYAEQSKKEKLFWNDKYHEDEDPTPRRAPVYVGAGLIAIGAYYLSRRRVHAETPASTKTRRMPGVYCPILETDSEYTHDLQRIQQPKSNSQRHCNSVEHLPSGF